MIARGEKPPKKNWLKLGGGGAMWKFLKKNLNKRVMKKIKERRLRELK